MKNRFMNISLNDILKGMPGITPAEGANLHENCVVMLHRGGHVSPTQLSMSGLTDDTAVLEWNDSFNSQMDRTYNDRESNTERAAVAVSVLLTKSLTDYTVIMRSRKGTGFDYLLGYDDDEWFVPRARLEASGIEKENSSNTIVGRFNKKVEQVTPTDASGLPAYISIVEFSNPKALFDIKRIV